MAYDRYDSRRDRFSDYERGRRDERGFFERAGDEIASWFGDDDADRRRNDDERMNRNPDRGYGRDRYAYGPARAARDDERAGRSTDWTSSDRDYRAYDRDFRSRRPSGDEVRGFAGSSRDQRGYDRSESPWGRDDYRRTSSAGSNRDNDRHYDSWRQRQVDELDRDYDQYCRERQERFENDFGSWREGRMSKRQHLAKVREHMDVVGSDGEPVGKVDKVRGDRIVLTKADADDNRHHSIDCAMVGNVEGDQVRLDMPAEEAKSRFKNERKSALFGRGPDHEGTTLERSFSGTYTD